MTSCVGNKNIIMINAFFFEVSDFYSIEHKSVNSVKKVLETGISRVFVKRLFFKFIISSKGEIESVFKADLKEFMDIEQTSDLLPPVFSSAWRRHKFLCLQGLNVRVIYMIQKLIVIIEGKQDSVFV